MHLKPEFLCWSAFASLCVLFKHGHEECCTRKAPVPKTFVGQHCSKFSGKQVVCKASALPVCHTLPCHALVFWGTRDGWAMYCSACLLASVRCCL